MYGWKNKCNELQCGKNVECRCPMRLVEYICLLLMNWLTAPRLKELIPPPTAAPAPPPPTPTPTDEDDEEDWELFLDSLACLLSRPINQNRWHVLIVWEMLMFWKAFRSEEKLNTYLVLGGRLCEAWWNTFESSTGPEWVFGCLGEPLSFSSVPFQPLRMDTRATTLPVSSVLRQSRAGWRSSA